MCDTAKIVHAGHGASTFLAPGGLACSPEISLEPQKRYVLFLHFQSECVCGDLRSLDTPPKGDGRHAAISEDLNGGISRSAGM